MSKIKLLFIVLFATIASNATSSDTITFGTIVASNSKIFSALNQIYTEAFSNSGLPFKSIPCTPTNCVSLVRDGNIEGITARNEDYINPSRSRYLEKIDFVLFGMSIVAITRNSKIAINSMAELFNGNYSIGFQTGSVGFKNDIRQNVLEEKLTEYVHWTFGVNALLSKKIDVFIALEQIVVPELDQDQYNHLLTTPIEGQTINIFPVVSTVFKHTTALKESLEQMRENGRIESIFSHYGIF